MGRHSRSSSQFSLQTTPQHAARECSTNNALDELQSHLRQCGCDAVLIVRCMRWIPLWPVGVSSAMSRLPTQQHTSLSSAPSYRPCNLRASSIAEWHMMPRLWLPHLGPSRFPRRVSAASAQQPHATVCPLYSRYTDSRRSRQCCLMEEWSFLYSLLCPAVRLAPLRHPPSVIHATQQR